MEGDDPVSLTMAAVGGSALLGAGSSVVGGIQANQAGKVAQQQAQNEAIAAQQQAGAEIGAQTTQAAKLISKDVAETGAAGITGESTKTVLSEDAAQARIKAAYTRYSGNLASQQALYGGQLARWQGNQQLASGIVGGVTNLLGGASSIGRIKLGGSP